MYYYLSFNRADAAFQQCSSNFSVVMIFLVMARFLTFTQSLSYNHAPNPRAVHPDGKLPTILQARVAICEVQRDIENMLVGGYPTMILVDGNNIRNSCGFRAVSAIELTKKLSFWSTTASKIDGTNTVGTNQTLIASAPQIICTWDGGSKRMSKLTMSILSALSGPDANADDLIVQCCSFLSKHACDLNRNLNVIVFTSDANLANRCNMQIMDGSKFSSDINCKIYHSIYLNMLVNGTHDGNNQGSGAFSPDWERKERRQSVEELQTFIEGIPVDKVKKDEEPIDTIYKWISDELVGLKIGRVTKGGSVLYHVDD